MKFESLRSCEGHCKEETRNLCKVKHFAEYLELIFVCQEGCVFFAMFLNEIEVGKPNKEIYRRLHPEDHRLPETARKCLFKQTGKKNPYNPSLS